MSKIVLKDVVIEVDGVELSDHASRITINTSKDVVDTTSFQSDFRSNLLGLGDASIDTSFFQDFDAGSVDATLWPLHEAGTVFDVLIKPATGAISPTNPAYRMAEAVLPDYTPLNGGVGDASTIDVRFINAGQTGVVRVTS